MRTRILSILAYAGAGLTLLIAVLVPFKLIGTFSDAVGHAGLHIDAAYTGGTVARTIERDGYRIEVYQPVRPRMLERIEPFVQIAFGPAGRLPAQVNDEIDLDGDGQPDVRVNFAVPADAGAAVHGSVTALNAKYISLAGAGSNSFSRFLARSGDRVVVRVPVK